MIKVTSELVSIFWQDGQKVGMLYQNGVLEMYSLRKATKADVATLLQVDVKEPHI